MGGKSKYGYAMGRTRLYSIWYHMKNRCLNKKAQGYRYYGGRGITICAEWFDFLQFRKWALNNGYADNLEIDRIDINGSYTPENCRWVIDRDQVLNRSVTRWYTINGITLCLKEWCEVYGIDYQTVRDRIDNGMDIKRALGKKPEMIYTINGLTLSLKKWCVIYKKTMLLSGEELKEDYILKMH